MADIPMLSYAWNESRLGALEIDLVEYNGGSSHGHFAYTLTVVDVVTAYTRRRALLGKSQRAVLQEIHCLPMATPAVGPAHLKNDRELVGYERYDTPEQVQWLNAIYNLHPSVFRTSKAIDIFLDNCRI
jgi:hypothetical protein